MLYGPDGITRVPYEGPQTLAVLNAAWQKKRAGDDPAQSAMQADCAGF
jgi:hypothetical protein